jgi:hypothetical protein
VVSRLERRVTEIQRRQSVSHNPIPPMLLVSPGQWPPEDEEASWAAEAVGDQAVMDDLVERHTGERPAPPGSQQVVVVLREVPGGPR